MAQNKRFYWLKLKADFFDDKRIKKLRKLENGDLMTIIYMKMMLKSINTGGYIHFEGIEDSFEEEVALDLNETGKIVKDTFIELKNLDLIELYEGKQIYLPTANECIGSETESAVRKRRQRERETSMCDNVTHVSHMGHTHVTHVSHECHTEKEKERDKRENRKDSYCGVAKAPPEQFKGKIIIDLILNDKSMYHVYENDVKEWEELYPGVDVRQSLRNMKGWLNSNPAKRKTKRGISRFINNWLAREQDKGGNKNKPQPAYNGYDQSLDDLDGFF